MTWDGIKRGKVYRKCADCGRRFKQWSWSSGYGRGTAYCRECNAERTRLSHRRPSDITIVCQHCGCEKRLNQLEASQFRTGKRPALYCSAECRRDDTRKYADKREWAREKKRRQRASRHARGLTSDGKPLAEADMTQVRAHAYRRVAPRGGSLERR